MIKVCIVDDRPEIRNSFETKINLEPDMECVCVYSNSEDALAGIPVRKPDVALMDIGLPGMSGIECLVRIKEKCPDTKFMMFTIFENDDTVFEALKAGADGYILKRETSNKVIECLREIHDGGAPMSRSIARKVLKSFQDKGRKPNSLVQNLTPRQMDILHLISRGLPNKLIGDQLNIVEGTVKIHIHNIYKKLQVNNRAEATKKYLGH